MATKKNSGNPSRDPNQAPTPRDERVVKRPAQNRIATKFTPEAPQATAPEARRAHLGPAPGKARKSTALDTGGGADHDTAPAASTPTVPAKKAAKPAATTPRADTLPGAPAGNPEAAATDAPATAGPAAIATTSDPSAKTKPATGKSGTSGKGDAGAAPRSPRGKAAAAVAAVVEQPAVQKLVQKVADAASGASKKITEVNAEHPAGDSKLGKLASGLATKLAGTLSDLADRAHASGGDTAGTVGDEAEQPTFNGVDGEPAHHAADVLKAALAAKKEHPSNPFAGGPLRADKGAGARASKDAERLAGKSRKVH